MSKHEATFEVNSKTDSYAVRRILEQLYDTVREESRSVRMETDDATALLESFDALRMAAKHTNTGKLTVTFEQYDSIRD